MILETLVTTVASDGTPNLAPMGVLWTDRHWLIQPFKPSTTLDNLLSNGQAVINRCDDVRLFAGCLTGRRDWPLLPSVAVRAPRLADALSHVEVVLERVEDDAQRPRLYCRILHEAEHRTFQGFNRAQFAVLEAAILVSRLRWLPLEKIEHDMNYLRSVVDKTAGPREREAWAWLNAALDEFKAEAERA